MARLTIFLACVCAAGVSGAAEERPCGGTGNKACKDVASGNRAAMLLQVHSGQKLAAAQLSRAPAVSKPAQQKQSVEKVNVCYFTNWARYREGLINTGKDVFEMGIDGDLCTHYMYGFATVKLAGDGSYMLESNDPNADHPTGHAAQDGLCPEVCNDASFKTDWSDPNGERCDWPCSPTRVMRGYEALTVGMKKKNPAIKALISVGGWNFNDCRASVESTFGQGSNTCEIFSTIARSEDSIRAFAANIISFCRKWGFDGFDLDWEYPVAAGHNSNQQPYQNVEEDYVNYITMLRVLKEEFVKENPTEPLLLTAAVGVGKSTADTAYDIPGMNQHLDLINLMTYDMHGAWESRTGCNANLFATAEDVAFGGGVGAGAAVQGYPLSVSWAVDYWLEKGASADKLTLGLGTYGRGWKLADTSNFGYNAPTTGASEPGPSTGEAGYRSYYEIQALIADGSATRYYDNDRKCPYVVTNGGEWIGYDDEESLRAKLEFMNERNLRGAMVWALDLDDFTQGYPLIRLAKDSLSGTVPVTPTSEPGPSTTQAPATSTTQAPATLPASTTTEAAATTTTTTTTQSASATTGAPSTGGCRAVPGNTGGATDDNCAQCAEGYQWWPCNNDELCICDSTTQPSSSTAAATTEAPSTTTTTTKATSTTAATTETPGALKCTAVEGNNGGATDENCAQCADGYQWWPCNSDNLCECTGGGS